MKMIGISEPKQEKSKFEDTIIPSAIAGRYLFIAPRISSIAITFVILL